MPGMKHGMYSIGIISISHGCTGVVARACGLVGLEPNRVVEMLKDRPSWFRDCRAVDVLNVLPTASGGTIKILYMQLYAPTTLASGHDFWLLRCTSVLDDGSLVVCERSLSNTQNGSSMPPVQNFVRAEMLPSGYLIRSCEGGGSIIHLVSHMNLEVERRDKESKERLNIIAIRLYLQGCPRLNLARKLLTERSKWYVNRIMNITPQFREFQALSSIREIPLLPVILNPVNQPRCQYESVNCLSQCSKLSSHHIMAVSCRLLVLLLVHLTRTLS